MSGYAPGWFVRCPKCGKRKTAAEIGMIRVGAISRGKRVLAWCNQCKWFSWLIVEKEDSGGEA